MAKLVAKTYGDALFDLALEQNKVDAYQEEVESVFEILKTNEELQKLMSHPKIIKDEKISIIENIFKGRISVELYGFMKIVVSKDRYSDIQNIFTYFINRVKEYKNIGTAFVTSAVDMNEAQKISLKEKLLATTKYEEIDIHYAVNKELIGGMVIRIGDRVVDSSIKTKIYELSKNLSKIQLV
jgi:F-type H+-transporting ATPase subunit delta